eukprot:ANDGO_05721.mRNA.1 hypothetical protein
MSSASGSEDSYGNQQYRSMDALELDDGMGEAHDLISPSSSPREQNISGRVQNASTGPHIHDTYMDSSEIVDQLNVSRAYADKLQKKVQQQASKLVECQQRIQDMEEKFSGAKISSVSVELRKGKVTGGGSGNFAPSEIARLQNMIRDREALMEKLEKEARTAEKRCDEFAKRIRDLKKTAEDAQKEASLWRKRAKILQDEKENKVDDERQESDLVRVADMEKEQVFRSKIKYLEQLVNSKESDLANVRERLRIVEKGISKNAQDGDPYLASIQVAEWKGKYEALQENFEAEKQERERVSTMFDQKKRELAASEARVREFDSTFRQITQQIQNSGTGSNATVSASVETVLAWKQQLDSMSSYVRDAAQLRVRHEELLQKYEQCRSELEEQQSLHSELLEALRDYKSKAEHVEDVERVNQDRALLITKLQADLSGLQTQDEEVTKLRLETERLRAERDEFEASLREMSNEMDRVEAESLHAVNLRKEFETFKSQFERIVQEKASEKRILSEEIAQLKQRRDSENEDSASYVADLEDKIATLNNEAEAMEIELQEKERSLKEFERELATTRQESIKMRNEYEDVIQSLKERLSSLESDGREHWHTQWSRSEELRGELRAMYDQVCREKSALEMRYAELRYEFQMMQLHYGIQPSDEPSTPPVLSSVKRSGLSPTRNAVSRSVPVRNEDELLRYFESSGPLTEMESGMQLHKSLSHNVAPVDDILELSSDEEGHLAELDDGYSETSTDTVSLQQKEIENLQESLALSNAARALVQGELQNLASESDNATLETVAETGLHPAEDVHKSSLQQRLERVRRTLLGRS